MFACLRGVAFGDVPRQNLAFGVKYELEPLPNYWGWKGPQHGDLGQLTDGKIIKTWKVDDGPFYALRSSMGWSGMPPVMIFDLGGVRSITGIGIHSALSPWGPWWPAIVAVLVSDDNETFYLAGPELKLSNQQLDPPLTDEVVQAAIRRKMVWKWRGPSTHWYRHDGLNATGRYVALIMTMPPDTGVIVVDEIEIYGSPKKDISPIRPKQVFAEGKGGARSYKLYRAMNERLTRDIDALKRKIMASSIDVSMRQRLLTQLNVLSARKLEMQVRPTEGFKAVLPINALHTELFSLHAALWRAQSVPDLRLWKTYRWDPLSVFEEPHGNSPKIEIVMAQNAVRSDVLNISNGSDKVAQISIELIGLPVEHLDINEVMLVDTQKFEPVAAPIIPAKFIQGKYRITVEPGMTRQIWLRCSSKGMSPGKYEGTVRLARLQASQVIRGQRNDNGWSVDVPVSVVVLPVRLPDRFSLYVGGWDYPWAGTYQITEHNLEQYLDVLKAYGVNTTWAANPFEFGKYDEDGHLVETPSRRIVDEWLERWPNASFYCAVLFYILPMDTPYRDKKLTAWARDWSHYMRRRGIPPDRVALLIRDEPTTKEELKIILDTGRAIKKGEPQFKIWNDIHYPDPTKAPPILKEVMRDACDIQCFNTKHYLDAPAATMAFMKQHSREDLAWWTYTGADNHRLTDPYVAWLLRFWFCFDKGLTGVHFWAFGDGNGGFSWNEYFNTGPTRSPLYLSPTSITIGKAIEAMREGAQDYELLKMLELELRKRDAEKAIIELRSDVQRVMADHISKNWPWKVPKDRSIAEEVRVKVLRALVNLTAQRND